MRTLTFLTFYSLICSWLAALVICFWLWLRSMPKSFHMFLLRDWYSHEIQCSFPCSCIGKDKIYAFHGGWINFQNRNFIVSSFHKVFQIYQICSFSFLFDRCFFFDFQFCEYRILDFIEMEHIVLKQSLFINMIFYVKYTTKVQYSHSFRHFQWYIVIRSWQFSHLGTLEN